MVARASLDYVLCAADAGDPALGADLSGAGVPVYSVRAGVLRKVSGGTKPVGWLGVVVLPTEVGPGDPYGSRQPNAISCATCCTAFRTSRATRELADQAELAGAGDRFGAVGRTQLGQDVADVFLDRVHGDDELAGDGLVGGARGQEAQHLHLPR